jgi:hypothetical protein
MGGDDREDSGRAEAPSESARVGLSHRLASLRHGMPYENPPADRAYTLGLLSMLFCVGIPCGVAAVIYGVLGLKRAAAVPQARGKGRAWVGIILGAVFALAYLVIAAAAVLDYFF